MNSAWFAGSNKSALRHLERIRFKLAEVAQGFIDVITQVIQRLNLSFTGQHERLYLLDKYGDRGRGVQTVQIEKQGQVEVLDTIGKMRYLLGIWIAAMC